MLTYINLIHPYFVIVPFIKLLCKLPHTLDAICLFTSIIIVTQIFCTVMTYIQTKIFLDVFEWLFTLCVLVVERNVKSLKEREITLEPKSIAIKCFVERNCY